MPINFFCQVCRVVLNLKNADIQNLCQHVSNHTMDRERSYTCGYRGIILSIPWVYSSHSQNLNGFQRKDPR